MYVHTASNSTAVLCPGNHVHNNAQKNMKLNVVLHKLTLADFNNSNIKTAERRPKTQITYPSSALLNISYAVSCMYC